MREPGTGNRRMTDNRGLAVQVGLVAIIAPPRSSQQQPAAVGNQPAASLAQPLPASPLRDPEPEGAMKAQDIMSKNPTCVTPDTTLVDAARLMKEENIGIVPVVESTSSRRLVGVVTDRDIAIRAVAEGRDGVTTSVG